ncbi:hypothetical protein [Nostoc sp.]|uniref:hypothetical protein n=1 Tax=Nostoc sp. TaxID=1180 RepID=UPI002FF6E73F
MAKSQVKKLTLVKVILGPVQFNGETFEDGETFEGDAKAIAPLIEAAVVVVASSSQEPLSLDSGGQDAPPSPTELQNEQETLPQSLIDEKAETLKKLK